MALSNESFAARLAQLRVAMGEIEEQFSRSSGPGGQHVNKVSTAVTLRHRPSGIAVTVSDSRSQAMNRALARERLLEAIERQRAEAREAQRSAREKVRRQNRPRPYGVKQRILKTKKIRSGVKKLRGQVSE